MARYLKEDQIGDYGKVLGEIATQNKFVLPEGLGTQGSGFQAPKGYYRVRGNQGMFDFKLGPNGLELPDTAEEWSKTFGKRATGFYDRPYESKINTIDQTDPDYLDWQANHTYLRGGAQNAMDEYGNRPAIGSTPGYSLRPPSELNQNTDQRMSTMRDAWGARTASFGQNQPRTAQVFNPQTKQYEWRTWDDAKQAYVMQGEVSRAGGYQDPVGSLLESVLGSAYSKDPAIESFLNDLGL